MNALLHHINHKNKNKMTNKTTLKMMLIFVAILATFSSCKKDEVSLRTGALKVNFTPNNNYLPVIDYTITLESNASKAISGLDKNLFEGVLTVKDLNPGNYYLNYNYTIADRYYSKQVLFQIHSGKTTELTFQL
ncbi:hypothetical protein JCM18694_29630 [Prolixibacter denitrificans]|uniref:Fimbrillin-A associated anchor protein Mfa1/Mfa2 n=2 Tax=Prolixibacter denitrificans TaxID=1541063 RepID=A0ABQ0ZMM6_9BACT|nr:hypothetical protein JCM18694_29630 [Prolixibacter denitrificans]